MNNNPFYIHPGGDWSEGLRGISGALNVMAEKWERQRKEQALTDRFAKIKQGAIEAYRTGDPDVIAEFNLRNPEMAEALNQAMRFKEEKTKRNYLESTFRALLNPEQALEIAENRQQFLIEQGLRPDEMIETSSFIQNYKNDPEKTMQDLEITFASLAPKELWDKYRSIKGAPAQGEKLTASHKDYNLAKKEGFKGNFIEYKQALLGGPKIDLEMMKLQTQIADIQERIQARKEAQELTKKKEKQRIKYTIRNIDNVLGEVDISINKAKKHPTATGILGAATRKIPGTPSYNIRRHISTIKANLGFDRLEVMKTYSPSGGALGQVSERELKFLQDSVAALDPNMGDKELIKALEKVKKHYTNWKNTLEEIKEITTQEEYDALPSGAIYLENGVQYRKP